MIYRVTVESEVAAKIAAKAAEKGLTPEKYLVQEIERVVASVEAENAKERLAKQAKRGERTAPL